ncbi:SRPBCC family protein [Corallococcus sp. BB11-1]|uniref:SRPBCC family protein n=1 Tax=Corallococcus sp. BB11-1 TaxID=2996783 RepID=UPI00226F503A|nr:SRPBCC family protein [Corallococcus sp. BB11-1]MCY1031909.1 SRPBCC family protein [Corallococcus sp. BB11-1]
MSDSHPVKLTVTHRFKASAERVFDAWLDPQKARHWFFVTNEDTPLVRSEVDARVGGRFCFSDLRDGAEVEHMGEYLEIDRPRRLVFLLTVPQYSTDSDRVTVEIIPQGTGCELTLTAEMMPAWAEYKDRTAKGWSGLLKGLDALLERTAERG